MSQEIDKALPLPRQNVPMFTLISRKIIVPLLSGFTYLLLNLWSTKLRLAANAIEINTAKICAYSRPLRKYQAPLNYLSSNT